MEKVPSTSTTENDLESKLNTIGELQIGFKDGLPTDPKMVYRTVQGQEAIEDLFRAGYVRNAVEAGVKESSRWGDRVFWSRGVSGKNHPLADGAFLIVAPFDIAEEGRVYKEDVTAIYTRGENGEIIDVLDMFS